MTTGLIWGCIFLTSFAWATKNTQKEQKVYRATRKSGKEQSLSTLEPGSKGAQEHSCNLWCHRVSKWCQPQLWSTLRRHSQIALAQQVDCREYLHSAEIMSASRLPSSDFSGDRQSSGLLQACTEQAGTSRRMIVPGGVEVRACGKTRPG